MSERKNLYRKTVSGFVPVNDEAREFHAKAKLGQEVELVGKMPRNIRFHRKYFAILNLISENSNPHISRAAALQYAKTAAGVGQLEPTGKGDEMRFIVGSISFAKMDQQAFDDFVKASIPPLVGRFMAGSSADDVIREAMEMVE